MKPIRPNRNNNEYDLNTTALSSGILKLIWTLIMLVATFARGQDQHAGPPDIMMYYNRNQFQVTCVAATNTYGNAMTFITPLAYFVVNPVFQYKDRNGNNIEEIGCDYEGNVDQQCNPKFTTIMSSGKDLTSPVTDERWNKFGTQYTFGGVPEYSYMYPINETNFHISFSVRIWRDAQILLCNSQVKTPRDSSAKCYWIVTDGLISSRSATFLRKCSDGIPDDDDTIGTNNPCKIPRVHKEVKLLQERKWTHFTVTRENGSTIKLWESNHRTPILEYTDEEPFDIERLYIRGNYYSKSEWKIHDYRYLVITKMNQDIKLGAQFSFSKSDTLCISLYVAVCSRCAMEIMIQSDRKTEATKIIHGKQGLFIPWQLVKLEVQVHSDIIYTLHILATAEAGVTDTFWAVDDIRRCYGDEIKVSSMQIAPRSMNSISCQSLQYPEWTFIQSRNINNFTECSDSRFTGTYCNISCKSILNSDYCENNMICRPAVLGASTQCTCAPNSSGPECSTECSYGYFGYNCRNKCGKCHGGTNRCEKTSGKCSSGCEEGYTPPPYCINTTGPVLLAPPTVLSLSHASVTLRLDNIATLGDWRADTFQIEYKLAGSAGPWQQGTRRKQLAKNIEVTIPGLQQDTTYSIRVVVYTINGDTYRLEHVPYTSATTTCEVNRMVNIEPSARHVNISLHVSSQICYSDGSQMLNYRWFPFHKPQNPVKVKCLELFQNNEEGCLITNYFVSLVSDNKRLYFSENREQIASLKPFKNYTIIIRNNLYPEYSYARTFTTMEDAPSDVRKLKALHISDTMITVTWDVPLEERVNAKSHIVSIELQKYFDCPSNANSDEPVRQYNFYGIIRITDLHPYARYKVSVFMDFSENITEIFDTLSSNHVSHGELPNNVTVVDSYSRSVVTWIRARCADILGPLRYNVSITCVRDAWCGKVRPVTREVDGFSNYISVDTLTPFTNYRLELRATRNGTISDQSIIVYFTTKEAAPPEVRYLEDYSRDRDSMSLRWLAPYPPHGTLEHYEMKYCHNTHILQCTYKRIDPVACSLWDEDGYMCIDITNSGLYVNIPIYVRAKNTGVIGYGTARTVMASTLQSSPSVPLHFHTILNQNMLTLHWNCPDLPGGPLKYFLITFQQFDTEILANKERNQEHVYKLDVDEQPLRKNYNYTIDQTIPYSTSYKITVCGVNENNGSVAEMVVNTAPQTPILAGDITINSEGITNTTISITIPGVQANTTSSTSYVYVIVSEQNSNNITKRDADLQGSSAKEEMLQFTPGAKDPWMAVEFPSSDSNCTFIVGSNSRTHSEHLNEDLINKPLTPSRAYDITVVLMNVYRDKRSYNDYKSRVITAASPVPSNPSSAGLYALLLLLFVPVLLYVLYRFVLKKLYDPYYNEADLRRVPSYSEVINEHDPRSNTNIEMNVIPSGAPVLPLRKNIAVNICDFEVYVKNALPILEFEKQYASISQNEIKPCKYGSLEGNIAKNQYKHVLPYDENRVVLNIIDGDPYSDYINASYIQGCQSEKDYIATQHPKRETANDFWRMIWQEDVKYIIMFNDPCKKQKSLPNYWPQLLASEDYGMVNVTHLSTDSYVSYEIRTFDACVGTECKRIKQLAFTAWPDYDIPNHPQHFTEFMRYVSKIPQDNAPIVVHCSAGIGRTGVIILSDICLRMAYENETIDVLTSAHKLQKQRIRIVNYIVHYKLVYLTLLDCLLSPHTQFSTDNDFYDHIRNMTIENNLQVQLDYLEKITNFENALVKKIKYTGDDATESKNRFPDIVPEYDTIQLSDHQSTNTKTHYINAVPVAGYKKEHKFIVTQCPLPNTLAAFWQMVFRKDVKVIISLNDMPENDMTCCVFWPANNNTLRPKQTLTIEHVRTEHHAFHSVFTLCMPKDVMDHTVHLVQLKGWPVNDNTSERVFHLYRILGDIESLGPKQFPVVVACYNGVTASGLFVALTYLMDQLADEDTCNVYAAIRVIRKNRKQFISNKEQLEFLYKQVLKYINKYETVKQVK